MEDTFRFPVQTTFESIEHFIDGVNRGGYPTVIFPGTVKEKLGTEIAAIQALCTWKARHPTAHLQVPTTKNGDQWRKLNEKLIGVSATLLAKYISDETGTSQKQRSLEEARHAIISMEADKAKFQMGRNYALLCADMTSRALTPALYRGDGTTRTISELTRLLERKMLKERSAAHGPERPVIDEIGRVLFEVFRNTHQWARHAVDGTPIRSLRGVISRLHQSPAEIMERRHLGSDPLSRYLNLLTSNNSGHHLRLLELSVFDGGPGLARRWLDVESLDSVPIAAERSACVECFAKHSSTSQSLHRGIGLASALQSLASVGGFMRLRTGRLCLWSDFSAHIDEVDKLQSWSSSTEEFGQAEGTTFTFLIPLLGATDGEVS